ncbi:GntR family transcriptional regulator [Aquabacterium sp.]|uniref:GntR family transcriptional regulator n=1 Tax=Aquabacterium sp. TaxID=1872578 RepID=UPI002D7FA818|nr:GntR family transcriptional regulator [Aquabacterium sp.]
MNDPGTASFATIEASDLVAEVEAQLIRAIVAGQLPPGSRIVEADIARRMSVSRAPVREAARRLERQGVLVSKPRHGFAVRTISAKEVDDLFQVRLHLELMAASLACEHASDAQLGHLLARVDVMVGQADRLTRAERVALDLAFHSCVCEISGNSYLQRLFSNMQTEVRMMLALNEEVSRDPKFVAESHRPIAEAIVRRDVAGASQALRLHLEEARVHVRALFMSAGAATP